MWTARSLASSKLRLGQFPPSLRWESSTSLPRLHSSTSSKTRFDTKWRDYCSRCHTLRRVGCDSLWSVLLTSDASDAPMRTSRATRSSRNSRGVLRQSFQGSRETRLWRIGAVTFGQSLRRVGRVRRVGEGGVSAHVLVQHLYPARVCTGGTRATIRRNIQGGNESKRSERKQKYSKSKAKRKQLVQNKAEGVNERKRGPKGVNSGQVGFTRGSAVWDHRGGHFFFFFSGV
jgi:hypothetical protein